MWTGVLKPSSRKDVWHGNLIVWACNASCFFIQVFNARTREICLKQSACIIIRSYSQWTIVSLFAWAGVKLFWITNYHHLWLPLTWISTVLNILIVFVSKYLFFTTRKRKWIKRKNQWQSMTKFKAAGILLFAILITFSRSISSLCNMGHWASVRSEMAGHWPRFMNQDGAKVHYSGLLKHAN